MIFSYDEWPGGHNIASSPYIWRRILEQLGRDHRDQLRPVAPRLADDRQGPLHPRVRRRTSCHVQAKDLMIDRDGLYERGILSAGIGWQVPRIPGLGEVDWRVLFSGALSRRLRRRQSSSSTRTGSSRARDELVKRGFLVARDVLRPFIK